MSDHPGLPLFLNQLTLGLLGPRASLRSILKKSFFSFPCSTYFPGYKQANNVDTAAVTEPRWSFPASSLP